MALGAQQSAVLAMILREAFVLVTAGIMVGIPVARGDGTPAFFANNRSL